MIEIIFVFYISIVISILMHNLWSGFVGIIHYRLHVVVTKGNIYEASYNLKIIKSSIIWCDFFFFYWKSALWMYWSFYTFQHSAKTHTLLPVIYFWCNIVAWRIAHAFLSCVVCMVFIQCWSVGCVWGGCHRNIGSNGALVVVSQRAAARLHTEQYVV